MQAVPIAKIVGIDVFIIIMIIILLLLCCVNSNVSKDMIMNLGDFLKRKSLNLRLLDAKYLRISRKAFSSPVHVL